MDHPATGSRALDCTPHGSGRPHHEGHSPLSDRERALLDFECAWAGRRGGKQQAISETFGFSAARYHQLIAGLVGREEAMAYDPLLVRRLRRRRRAARNQSVATGLADQNGRGVTK